MDFYISCDFEQFINETIFPRGRGYVYDKYLIEIIFFDFASLVYLSCKQYQIVTDDTRPVG